MLLNSLFKHWSYKLFTPGTVLREKYEALKQLLAFDINCHQQMAELQDLLHTDKHEDFASIRMRFALFSEQVAGMVNSLEIMSPGDYPSLRSYHKKFDFYTRFLLAPPSIQFDPPFVFSFKEISTDSKEIGNKAKHLALLQNDLNLSVPQGFAIPSSGYHYVVEYNDLRSIIDKELATLDIESSHCLEEVSKRLRNEILSAEIPQEIILAINMAIERWKLPEQGELRVAVRSSAINEDGDCSFAGQYATVLNVKRDDISSAYLHVLASKYSPEALFYRISKGMGDEETAMSVLIQEMVPAQCSGVLYTSDITGEETKERHLHLHVTTGLGEKLVGGTITPDHYEINRSVPLTILTRDVKDRVISEEQVLFLADQGLKIEKYFNTPQDIEWAIDFSGKLFILQARTLHTSAPTKESTVNNIDNVPTIIEKCEQASRGIAAGPVYLIDEINTLEDIPKGAVLVSRDAPPEYVRVINHLSAIISERGSRASHFATVAREFGIPFLAGVSDATKHFQAGTTVTVDGNNGRVYRGEIKELLRQIPEPEIERPYQRILTEAMKFITPLELIDPTSDNFTPEGCRSMHDIIRFCHEKAVLSMFSAGKPGTGRGSIRLNGDIPLDVFLFDVGGGITKKVTHGAGVPLNEVGSSPFDA